jgi:hypothetical protein
MLQLAVHIVITGLHAVKASGLQVFEYVVQWGMGGRGASIFL